MGRNRTFFYSEHSFLNFLCQVSMRQSHCFRTFLTQRTKTLPLPVPLGSRCRKWHFLYGMGCASSYLYQSARTAMRNHYLASSVCQGKMISREAWVGQRLPSWSLGYLSHRLDLPGSGSRVPRAGPLCHCPASPPLCLSVIISSFDPC